MLGKFIFAEVQSQKREEEGKETKNKGQRKKKIMLIIYCCSPKDLCSLQGLYNTNLHMQLKMGNQSLTCKLIVYSDFVLNP